METTWAARVRELEAIGWTLTGLADAIGLSAQGVSDIKQGRTKAPTGMAAVVLHRLHAGRIGPAANDDGPEEQGGQAADACCDVPMVHGGDVKEGAHASFFATDSVSDAVRRCRNVSDGVP